MLIGRYTALLDANVMHPAFLRGALLWFADESLFQPAWSPDILREWKHSLERRFPDIDPARLDAQAAVMNEQFPAAEIEAYHHLIPVLELPDENDRHVLAAAIIGKCDGLITCNTKDFPTDRLAAYRIEVVHPDAFIVNVIDLDEGRALAACRRHREAMTKSKPDAAAYLAHFEATGLIQSHQRLRPHIDLL